MSLPALLGLRPAGDPAGLRLYAQSLRSSAELIAAAGDGAASTVDAATFEGPAGEATSRRAGRLRGRTQARGAELRALADAITTQATRLEDDQHAWDRMRERIRREPRELPGPP